ncbi:MAG TPA: hypothetical protein VE090_01565 [Methylomirabilota bacterium]|nr:hypothetical protein [Methylomirabilota bacterium]
MTKDQKLKSKKQKYRRKILHFLFFISIFEILSLIFDFATFAALPASTNFKLQEYSFGAGGTTNSTSTNFKLNGIAGQIEFGRPSSTNFKAGIGLTYMMKTNLPLAPTLSNPSTNYDRLKIVINTGSNPTDATYAVQISTDPTFATNSNYVKNDFTIGPTLATTDFQTDTLWGSASGVSITGLARNTTYYVRAKARQGNFTETEWGPASSGIATSDPSLTFSIDSSTLTFTNLNASNAYTDSSKTTTITTSTNAYNGYVVNARETAALTAGATTIADYISPNSTPTVWSGTGFGYTTNDNNITGGTPDRFTNGGPKYAGFTTSSPGDPVADHPGPVLTAIANEQFTITYRVTTSSSQKAAKYTTSVLYIVVPSY